MSSQNDIDFVNVKLIRDKTLVYKEKLTGPEAVVNAMYDFMHDLDREVLITLNLNEKYEPINCNIVSIGDSTTSIANIGLMLKSSILSNAVNVISLHNHPSGNTQPSKEDYMVFKKLENACELMGINLADNIIVGEGIVYSDKSKKHIPINEYNLKRATIKENSSEVFKINTIHEFIDKYYSNPKDDEYIKQEAYKTMRIMINDLADLFKSPELKKKFTEKSKEEGYKYNENVYNYISGKKL